VIGFAVGLRRWRRLLRAGGYIGVSEVAWLRDNPPSEALEFWSAEYPAITSIEENLATLRSAGYEPIDHFTLPAEDWSLQYYEPLQRELDPLRKQHEGDGVAQGFADELRHEIDIYRRFGDSYGYVFYLARTLPSS
jgi:serine/threonine-protein kinase HipA